MRKDIFNFLEVLGFRELGGLEGYQGLVEGEIIIFEMVVQEWDGELLEGRRGGDFFLKVKDKKEKKEKYYRNRGVK